MKGDTRILDCSSYAQLKVGHIGFSVNSLGFRVQTPPRDFFIEE